jgi:outer membrane protein OmpA-like peptidoglycan-associated protein
MARSRPEKLVKNGKQIKRNVVSLVGKSEKLISAKMLVAVMTASLFISPSLSNISLGADLEIQQRVYHYQIPFAQVVSAETFVISLVSKQNQGKVAISNKPAPSTPDPVLHFTQPATVHFLIDSAEISSEEQTQLLSLLHEFEIPQNASLIVTGYTCKMGPTKFNSWLSEERAKAVAELLKKEGYTVAKIEGKGASDIVSNSYAPYNRRVEVTPFETNPPPSQPQISIKEENP